ncbi:MAG: Sua5 family C-terminal domain-containing protein [Thermoleophilia bacterium]
MLDGGPTEVGVESTVLDLTVEPPQVLRPGGLDAGEIEAVLGGPVDRIARGPARAPGMLASHYAPAARVEIVEDVDGALARAAALAGEGRTVALLAPGAFEPPPGVAALEPAGSPEAYARALYDRLREADRRGVDVLVVVPPPADGIPASPCATASGARRTAAVPARARSGRLPRPSRRRPEVRPACPSPSRSPSTAIPAAPGRTRRRPRCG